MIVSPNDPHRSTTGHAAAICSDQPTEKRVVTMARAYEPDRDAARSTLSGKPQQLGKQMDDLVVEYCGEVRRVAAHESLCFGRRGDLAIDDNPFMHRVVGRFECSEGRWWIHNVGAAAVLAVHDRRSSAVTSLPPGSAAPVVYGDATVRFSAGPTAYELAIQVPLPDATTQPFVAPPATTTIDFGRVPLTDDQRKLIVALCESALRDPSAPVQLPTNRLLARRLGWTLTKYNRKLDNVCERLSRQGVRGLHRSEGRAADRRQVLIRHAMTAELVTARDLELLD